MGTPVGQESEAPDTGDAQRRAGALRRAGGLVFPTHFAAPHVARITSSRGGFGVEFVPERSG